MNYLQLCQRLREKVGASGEGPTSVTGQRGEYARIVNWIDEAWIEIQRLHNTWAWMHKEASGSLVPGQMAYTAASFGISDFGRWDINDIRLYDVDVSDEKYLLHKDYDQFKAVYGVGKQTPGRPGHVSVNRANEIVFGPVPDKAYTVNLEYYQAPQHLVNNGDVPGCPEEYHMAIVYKAMEYYGLFENAPEVINDAVSHYRQVIADMESTQLPDVLQAYPLV